jgi:hypothetical protein
MFKFNSEGKIIDVKKPYIKVPFLKHDINCVTFYVYDKNQIIGFYNKQTGSFINKLTGEFSL